MRDYCVRVLDRLVGRDGFDFVRDFAFQVPMRVIGLLLGIPEQEQEKVRDYVDAGLSSEPGKPNANVDDALGRLLRRLRRLAAPRTPRTI